jgi:hypothetical protein
MNSKRPTPSDSSYGEKVYLEFPAGQWNAPRKFKNEMSISSADDSNLLGDLLFHFERGC